MSWKDDWEVSCHAQSLAATNRVTEQLNWLTVESFFMSCSIISWMASLIDNLYLLDLIGSFFGWCYSWDLTDNKKKEEGGLKQRRKQKEAAQGDPEPKKGNQEKEKYPSRVQS